jgi:hypothetical protein
MTDLAHHFARWLTVLAALVAAGSLLAGCGDDGAATGAKSPSGTTQAARTKPAPTYSAPTDRASAKRALMTIEDLPPGWTKGEERYPEGLSCGSFKPLAEASETVHSGRLHQRYSDVQELIAIFPTEAAATEAYRQLNSKKAERCLLRTMHQRIMLHSGTDGIGLVIEPLRTDLVDDLGPSSRAVNYSTSFRSEVGVARQFVDVVRSKVGRSVAVLLVVSGFTFVDYEQAASLIIRRQGGTLS